MGSITITVAFLSAYVAMTSAVPALDTIVSVPRQVSAMFGAEEAPPQLPGGSINCIIEGVDVGFHCLMHPTTEISGEETGDADTQNPLWTNRNARTCAAKPDVTKEELFAQRAVILEQLKTYRTEKAAQVAVREGEKAKAMAERDTDKLSAAKVEIQRLNALIKENTATVQDMTESIQTVLPDNVHCHGSDRSDMYRYVITDHLQRNYKGSITCACGYKAMVDHTPDVQAILNQERHKVNGVPKYTLDHVASDCDITTVKPKGGKKTKRYNYNKSYPLTVEQQSDAIPNAFQKITNRNQCVGIGFDRNANEQWGIEKWGEDFLREQSSVDKTGEMMYNTYQFWAYEYGFRGDNESKCTLSISSRTEDPCLFVQTKTCTYGPDFVVEAEMTLFDNLEPQCRDYLMGVKIQDDAENQSA